MGWVGWGPVGAGRSVSGGVSPQVPAVPEGRPAAADLPSQLLHAGGAARRGPARGHRAVPRLHGVSAGSAAAAAAALVGVPGQGRGFCTTDTLQRAARARI